jgi:hypothetical protein
LYDIYKTYDEKDQIKDILSRVPKPRLSTSSRPGSQPTEQQIPGTQNPNMSAQIKSNVMPNNPANNLNNTKNANSSQILNNSHNMAN